MYIRPLTAPGVAFLLPADLSARSQGCSISFGTEISGAGPVLHTFSMFKCG